MKRGFYFILLYSSLFAFIYPEKYTFLPISSIWIVELLAIVFFVVFFAHRRLWTEIRDNIIIGCIIFLVGFVSSRVLNKGGDFFLANRGLFIILYPVFGVWISYIINKSYKTVSVYSLLEILIDITIIQALISIVFFLVPSASEIYRGFVTIDDSTMSNIELFSEYRLVGVGDVKYATGAVQYGLMMWGVILLRHVKYGRYGNNNLISLVVTTLFIMVGVMSARTYFVMMAATFPYVLTLKRFHFKSSLREICSLFIPAVIAGGVVFIYVFASNEQLVLWMFELFLNMIEGGQLESESTNQLAEMYVFPSNLKTWLIGDGRALDNDGFYMSSDVGYIRSVFYWGMIGTVLYLYFIYKLCKQASKNDFGNRPFRVFVSFIFIWLLIYWLKDLYSLEKVIATQAMSKRVNNRKTTRIQNV